MSKNTTLTVLVIFLLLVVLYSQLQINKKVNSISLALNSGTNLILDSEPKIVNTIGFRPSYMDVDTKM